MKTEPYNHWAGRRVLLATSEPVHPVSTGGIQSSAHDLLEGLTNVLGADARLLSAARPGDFKECRRRLEEFAVAYTSDEEGLLYGTGRYHASLTATSGFAGRLNDLIRNWRPEIVVAQAAGWRDVVVRSRAANVPVVHWMHGWLGLLGDEGLPQADLLLANSEYTAEQVVQRFQMKSEVFHPPIEPERVRAGISTGPAGIITMINPHPSKGVRIFLDLARRIPERRFRIVDGWGTAPYIDLAISQVPNVDHLRAHSDMCDIYGETSVLVVPTTIDETFGRVVVEAQLNGIPVLASDRGALPDVVGGGGAVLAVEKSIELWSSTLKRLLDPQRYAQLSAAAVVNASRFDFTRSICRFASLVDTMLDQGHAANG